MGRGIEDTVGVRGARWGDRPDHQATGRDRQMTSAPSQWGSRWGSRCGWFGRCCSRAWGLSGAVGGSWGWRWGGRGDVAGGLPLGGHRGLAVRWALGFAGALPWGWRWGGKHSSVLSGSQHWRAFSSVRLEVVSAVRARFVGAVDGFSGAVGALVLLEGSPVRLEVHECCAGAARRCGWRTVLCICKNRTTA